MHSNYKEKIAKRVTKILITMREKQNLLLHFYQIWSLNVADSIFVHFSYKFLIHELFEMDVFYYSVSHYIC